MVGLVGGGARLHRSRGASGVMGRRLELGAEEVERRGTRTRQEVARGGVDSSTPWEAELAAGGEEDGAAAGRGTQGPRGGCAPAGAKRWVRERVERLGVELLALDEDGAEDDGCRHRSRSSPWRSKEEGGDRGRGALWEDGGATGRWG